MPKAKFVIRNPKEKKEQSIIIIFRYKNKRFYKSLGISISPKNWNPKTQRARNTNDVLNKDEINNYLNEWAMIIEQVYNKLLTSKQSINNQTLLKEVNKHFNLDQQTNDLFSYIENFIKKSSSRINPRTKKRIAESTISTYKETLRILSKFNKEKYSINFDTITLDFYYDFVAYMQEEQNYSLNNCGKHIKNLKVFLNEATEDGTNTNLAYKSKRFLVLKEDVDSIYLSTKELLSIYNLDLSHDKSMDRARDLFLIGAFTGLRVSDFNNLKEENILSKPGGKLLKVNTKKTGEQVVIPLTSIVENILNKYDGKPPRVISEKNLNPIIKVIGRLAGIRDKVSMTITKGGITRTATYFKYELIKTHTARRSFCTNAYLSGIDTLDIMAISGHKTESAFKKYVKVTKEQHAEKMLDHPFFKNNHLKVV
ncbi:MAG: site-specific integrase [Hyphomicrobiales bacterium]